MIEFFFSPIFCEFTICELQSMESQFEQFCPLIRALNENDDTIALDRKLHYLSNDIRDVLRGNEQALRFVFLLIDILHTCNRMLLLLLLLQ